MAGTLISMTARKAKNRPMSASPAMRPEASSTPVFSTRADWASLSFLRATTLSAIPRIRPPRKMANVVSSGRYMPTHTSIGLFTRSRMKPMAMRMPTMMRGQAMSPPTMPCDRMAIRLAWGAGYSAPPRPVPPRVMSPWWRIQSGMNMTPAERITPKKSPTCIFHGVPPRMWPTFKSCSISPATAAATQITAATPSTAATPGSPLTPNATMSNAATMSVDRVRPLIGLLLEPMSPTR